jgi:nucleotide-binding universal stress UspA family protein
MHTESAREPSFRHIVIGCDGSPEGSDAVVLGAGIAAASGARVTLVGVFPISLFPITNTDRQTLRRNTEQTLRAQGQLFAPDAVIHAVADLSVPRALRHFAVQWRADLVVVGSDHQAPTGGVAITARARQLLHEAPYALAVAQRGLHEREFALRSIGVGYDGGPEAEQALQCAAALGRGSGATLSLVSVVEDRIPALTGQQWMQTRDWSHYWEPQRETALVHAQAATSSLAVTCKVSAAIGDPAHELRDLSATVDLLVVGSRRWGIRARLLAGSVGEGLVADCGCSLLIVPRPAASESAQPQIIMSHR